MAEQHSDLEKAISTFVNQFYSATENNSPTLKTEEFKSLVSSQLPSLAKTVGSEQGIGELLQQMGVKDGDGITFKDFWSLIQSMATSQYGLLSQIKPTKCGCVVL